MQVPVRLHGKDSQGKPFEEETETLAINAHGALVLLQARVTSGSLINVQHKRTTEEQECSVVFLGPVRGNKAEIGLEFLDAPPPILARRLPSRGLVTQKPGSAQCFQKKSFVVINLPTKYLEQVKVAVLSVQLHVYAEQRQ